MKRNLNIYLVSKPPLFREVADLLQNSSIEAEIVHYNNYKMIGPITSGPDIVIVGFEKLNEAREILSLHKNVIDAVPLLFVYPDKLLSLSDYKDLIINGAYGMIPKGNLKSLLQHIIQLEKNSFGKTENRTLLHEDLFVNYFNSSDSLVSLINSDLKYESVNESFSKFHNLKREDLRGLCPSQLWGEEAFKSGIESNLKRSLQGEIIRYKAYFDENESPARCYEVIYRPFQPSGSKRVYTLVETRDITHSEEIAKKATEASERNYYYEKYLPYGIFEADIEGNIISANETFYNILEIPVGSRENLNLKDFAMPENRFGNYLKSVHLGESSTFSQLPMHTASGNEIFTRISSHTRDTGGGKLLINATLEDNTREVLLERKLNQTLRMETMGTLAGGIAHDFNTILTTITGYSELAMDEAGSDSKVYDYMTKLLHSVDRAENIVKQMLTFSRQIDVKYVPVKIEKVVEDVCEFMQSALPYNVALKCEIEQVDGYVNADPTQLFRVFLNILTNSMQSIEGSEGKLTVKVSHLLSKNTNSATITVSDTGKGIDKAILDRIYEPFFSTKDPGHGTGMGLAVAHGIISEMGGEISVESTSGKGTTFIINLPVYDQDEISDPASIEEHTNRHGTVLYADNNIYFSRTVSLALERLGYKVRLASELKDIESYLKMEEEEDEDDIIFFRCVYEDCVKEKIINRIVSERPKSRIVLITKTGYNHYRSMLNKDRDRITIITEPVTLRDIFNSIQNRI